MRLLLFVSLATSYLCFVAGQSPCTTPNRKVGSCVNIYTCNSLLKLISNPSPTERELLQNSFCGFDGSAPQVCCPKDTCTTPDGGQGNCISLYSCPHLMNMLGPNRTEETLQYVTKSRCEGSETYSVCCGQPPVPKPNINPSPGDTGNDVKKCQLTALPPDPSTNCCGRDASGGVDRIVGGNSTAVDEYPWLALIEYSKDNKLKLLCGGVLISGRYVLSAAHCVVGPVLNAGTPVNVRLGEYNTSNNQSTPDCEEVSGGGQDCNDGAVTYPIENIIPHGNYSPSSKLRRDDIALIKTRQLVQFTDFIRPICLPTTDFTIASGPGLLLFAAGWGAVSEFQSSSSVKLKVSLPYLSYQDCQPSYAVSSRRVQLWEGQICAGGVKGQDSCKGDSGGPLMRENGRFFELVGIVSFGPTPCGMENVAGVYTKVFHYLPWIRSQIDN